jgi:hypothetical protein
MCVVSAAAAAAAPTQNQMAADARVAIQWRCDRSRAREVTRPNALRPLSRVSAPSMMISWHFSACLQFTQSLSYLLDGFSSTNRPHQSEKDATASCVKRRREITASPTVGRLALAHASPDVEICRAKPILPFLQVCKCKRKLKGDFSH